MSAVRNVDSVFYDEKVAKVDCLRAELTRSEQENGRLRGQLKSVMEDLERTLDAPCPHCGQKQ